MSEESRNENKSKGLFGKYKGMLKSALLVVLCGAAGFGGGSLANYVGSGRKTETVTLQESTSRTEDNSTADQDTQTSESQGAALGVYVQTVSGNSSVEDGVYIVGFSLGSKAEEAGLQAGDRIVSVDGTEMTTGQEVSAYISSKKVGDSVEIVVDRDGTEVTIEVELIEKTTSSSEEDFPSSGSSHNG